MCCKRKSSIGRIYKTTDGSFGKNGNNKKPRRVIAVDQRKRDGAIVVVKIYKKEGKDPSDKSKYIQGVELNPEKHFSLSEPSIVSKRAIFGKKSGNKYTPIFPQKMTYSGDLLKGKELRIVRNGIQNDTKKYRKTYIKTVKQWKKGFK